MNINLNNDLIKNIAGLVSAIIPPIAAIITILIERLRVTHEPIDSPSLKIHEIKRLEISDNEWNKIKHKYNIFFFIVFFVIFIFNVSIYVFLIKSSHFLILILFLSISLFSLITIMFLISNSYKFAFGTTKGARFYIFQNICIKIEADYHYLYNKCYEALKRMKLRVVEVNITEEKGYIEACQIPIFKRAKSITVKIEREGNSGNVYIVKLELSKKIGLSEGSKFINNFTHYLITKHKSKEENASK